MYEFIHKDILNKKDNQSFDLSKIKKIKNYLFSHIATKV